MEVAYGCKNRDLSEIEEWHIRADAQISLVLPIGGPTIKVA